MSAEPQDLRALPAPGRSALCNSESSGPETISFQTGQALVAALVAAHILKEVTDCLFPGKRKEMGLSNAIPVPPAPSRESHRLPKPKTPGTSTKLLLCWPVQISVQGREGRWLSRATLVRTGGVRNFANLCPGSQLSCLCIQQTQQARARPQGLISPRQLCISSTSSAAATASTFLWSQKW